MTLTDEQETKLYNSMDTEYKGDKVAGLVYQLTRKYIKSIALDVGAGTGAMLRVLEGEDIYFVGIDKSPKGKRVIRASLDQLSPNMMSYSTIILMDIIEHKDEKQLNKMLNKCTSLLMPGGHIIITTILNERLQSSTRTCPDCGFSFHINGHAQSFTEEQLTDILKQHGLKAVYSKRLNLTICSLFPFMRLFYSLNLNKIFPQDILWKDIVLVAEVA